MTSKPTVSERLEQQRVAVIESSIPDEMTIAQWRRRHERRRARRSGVRTPVSVRHLASVPEPSCDHLRDATSRYDHAAKVLTFLLVCHACGTEKVIEALPFEPRFEPSGAPAAALAA